MDNGTCLINVKVLAHCFVQQFAGEAILAATNPRFVVALLIADTKSPFVAGDTGVVFTTHRVALFAINSITKVFAESDVIGKEYQLKVEQREIGGKKSYSLANAG